MMVYSKELTDRQTSVELLRIIAMLFIVAGHSVIHGEFQELPLTTNGIFALILTQGSRIGVDIFILITGYFSVGREVTNRKIRQLYIQILSYSLVITVVMYAIGEVTIFDFIYAVFPIITSRYWFVTCYVLLTLISPALQLFINNVEKTIYKKILLILFFMWSVFPTLHIGQPGYSNFGWFIFVYLLAAYIHIWKPNIIKKIKIYHGFLLLILIDLAAAMTYIVGNNIDFFKQNSIYLYSEMNTISGILCAVVLFCGFRNAIMKNRCIVNKIAGCMFGVYLFHDNPYIRHWLWSTIMKNQKWINKNVFPIHMVISILSVFIIGIIIEGIRQIIVKKVFNENNKKRNCEAQK